MDQTEAISEEILEAQQASEQGSELLPGAKNYTWRGQITNRRISGDEQIVAGHEQLRNENTGLAGKTGAEAMNIYRGTGESESGDKYAGTGVPAGMTPDELLVHLGLDWEVKTIDGPPPVPTGGWVDPEEDPNLADEVIAEIAREAQAESEPHEPQDPNESPWTYNSARSVPRTIYRDLPDGKKLYFGTATTGWTPFQNHEVLKAVTTFAELGEVNLERAGMTGKGQTLWFITDISEAFELAGGDRVTGKVILSDGRTGSKGMSAKIMAERCICRNGLVLPVKIREVSYSHLKAFDNDSVTRALLKIRQEFAGFEVVAQNLASASLSKVSQAVTAALVVDLLGNPNEAMSAQSQLVRQLAGMKDSLPTAMILASLTNGVDRQLELESQPVVVQDILNLYNGAGRGSEMLSAYGTTWGLLNSVTEHYNHKARGSVDGRFQSLMTGTAYSTQAKALQNCTRVAVALR